MHKNKCSIKQEKRLSFFLGRRRRKVKKKVPAGFRLRESRAFICTHTKLSEWQRRNRPGVN